MKSTEIIEQVAFIYTHRDNDMELKCEYLGNGRRRFSLKNCKCTLRANDVIIKYADNSTCKTAHLIEHVVDDYDPDSQDTVTYTGTMKDMFMHKLVKKSHVKGLK
jgi:hypothetical protein